ncbi:hypothetical protein B0T16DRAFT_173650 [Cercophora newfieldiana]|uniref:Fungal N-terminal domain-containing protein n=1 Tax=Cercophora newfieldiana TaxID=92897 RepID=A0AA39XYX0_9PEZI|nr:hypothetical protein B0T16DRAFT_173650 [Cercophora newfieldiana]
MDPFSIATGVFGLLGTAATVIKFLDTVKSTIEDVPRSIGWALAEVNDVHSAIARLHSLFEHIDSVPNASRRLVAVQDAAVAVSELISSFDHLIDLLKPFGATNLELLKAWDKMKWVLKQDDVAKAVMRIQTHKGSLTLMLNILQCESDVVAMESRAALEQGINTLIEGNIVIQKRLDRMERLFIACLDDPSRASLAARASGSRGEDTLSVRSAAVTVRVQHALPAPEPEVSTALASDPAHTGATDATIQEAGAFPAFRLEFEEALAESGVYRRVQRPFDTFSIMSGDGHSIARTVMTTYSLAENASVLSSYPILDRAELRHPEFYASNRDEYRQARRFLGIGAARDRRSSEPGGSTSRSSLSESKNQAPPNLGTEVMGKWAATVRRTWRPRQFRFEVLFEVPVFFVCPPTNRRGPVRDAPIVYLDGTEQSLIDSRTMDPYEGSTETRVAISYALSSERASWLTLLAAIHDMERHSRQWDRESRFFDESLSGISFAESEYTTSVAIQSKLASWDKIPPGVRKPYATTVMAHIVEISALLGVHWLEFDRVNDRYFAEGGGFTLKGESVPGLGIAFEFQRSGGTLPPENRLIPTDDFKSLCFGSVPTIFRRDLDTRRLQGPDRTGRVEYLELSSRNEFAKTLTHIGCNASTIEYLLRDGYRDYHVFPVAFELIGMLCPILHIRGTGFRRLPNPTNHRWDVKSLSFWPMLLSYEKCLMYHPPPNVMGPPETANISAVDQIRRILEGLRPETEASAHVDLGQQDPDVSQPWNGRVSRQSPIPFKLQRLLHGALVEIDTLMSNRPHAIVQTVLRIHLQEVFRGINERGAVTADDDGMTSGPRFQDIYDSSPETKCDTWMEVYFKSVLPKVMAEVTGRFPDEAGAVWHLLVFRMLCWLMLHDFDPNDVQISEMKRTLLGSRLPVYIL